MRPPKRSSSPAPCASAHRLSGPSRVHFDQKMQRVGVSAPARASISWRRANANRRAASNEPILRRLRRGRPLGPSSRPRYRRAGISGQSVPGAGAGARDTRWSLAWAETCREPPTPAAAFSADVFAAAASGDFERGPGRRCSPPPQAPERAGKPDLSTGNPQGISRVCPQENSMLRCYLLARLGTVCESSITARGSQGSPAVRRPPGP